MNIAQCNSMMTETQHIVGRIIKYENKSYKVVEVIIAPDSEDATLFAIDYLLNRQAEKALIPFISNDDLELFIYCQRIGFNTPFLVKLNEVEILDYNLEN